MYLIFTIQISFCSLLILTNNIIQSVMIILGYFKFVIYYIVILFLKITLSIVNLLDITISMLGDRC